MDKKNIIIGGSLLIIAGLVVELTRLARDFSHAQSLIEERDKIIEDFKNIATDVIFEDIAENYDED